jgi:hypothetical protein
MTEKAPNIRKLTFAQSIAYLYSFPNKIITVIPGVTILYYK